MLPGDARAHAVDLRNAAQSRALARECADVDIRVNDAGDIPGGTLETIDDAQIYPRTARPRTPGFPPPHTAPTSVRTARFSRTGAKEFLSFILGDDA